MMMMMKMMVKEGLNTRQHYYLTTYTLHLKILRTYVKGLTFKRKQICHFHVCLPSKWDQLIEVRICSYRSKFSPLRLDSLLEGFWQKKENRKSQKLSPFLKIGRKWVITPNKAVIFSFSERTGIKRIQYVSVLDISNTVVYTLVCYSIVSYLSVECMEVWALEVLLCSFTCQKHWALKSY